MAPAAPLSPTLPAEWRDFLALTKPRVMSLVVFTGLCGLLAAPTHVNPVIGFTAILPHGEVADYYRARAAENERWLAGMNHIQRTWEQSR